MFDMYIKMYPTDVWPKYVKCSLSSIRTLWDNECVSTGTYRYPTTNIIANVNNSNTRCNAYMFNSICFAALVPGVQCPASLYNLMHIYRIPPAYRQNILDGYNSGLVSITAKFNVTIVNVLPCVFHLCDTCIFSKRIQ